MHKFITIGLTAVAALLLHGQASAAEPVTPAIAGVVAGGVKIELVKDGFNGTEGPITLPDGGLIFTETKAERIIRIQPDGAVSTFLEKTNGANGLAFDNDGLLYAVQVLKPRVGVIYPAGKEKNLVENDQGTPFQRPNDLVRDQQGGLYFTDSGTRATPENPNPPKSNPGVYYLSPAGELKRLANDIERPNGITLSKDEKTLYVANTLGEQVFAFDLSAPGVAGNRRHFAKLEGWQNTEQGWSSGADGLAIDELDRLYVTSNAGIEVFDKQGQALGVIPIPKKPQNLAFAGQDKKTLYVVGRGAVYKLPVLTAGFKGRAK